MPPQAMRVCGSYDAGATFFHLKNTGIIFCAQHIFDIALALF